MRAAVGAPGSTLAPAEGDRVLFDVRSTLQQAQTLRDALALFRVGADTRPGWGFTTDMDGAGTHALRVDWLAADGSCTSTTPDLSAKFPLPAPRAVFVQFKQRLGRTPTGGGVGELGQFDVVRAECGTSSRFVGMVYQASSYDRVEMHWGTGEPGTSFLIDRALPVTIAPNQGWSFLPQKHVGEVIEHTVYIRTESAAGAGDGVVQWWINGRLLIYGTGLALGPEAVTSFRFPWTSPAPLADQSEYFWGLVAWEPAATSPPSTPPPSPVAKVDVAAPTATIQVGSMVQLTATPRDVDGNALWDRTVTWTSSDASVATVSATGAVTGVASGTAKISATSEGRSGTAAVNVIPTAGESVLVGAGDMSSCSTLGDDSTAALLDQIPGTVFTAGDNVYPDGTLAAFNQCYQPSWGRHKARTRPAPGNHDYQTPGAAGYFGYFGDLAGPAGLGYYSYDLGSWHVISLNSNIDVSSASAQAAWLRDDLAAHPAACTLAYWHRARFSSGADHGSSTYTRPLWQLLYDAGAEVVLSGHDHVYERFAPQTPQGVLDTQRGIRQFVVGTGGRSLDAFRALPAANSEVRYNASFGVLKLRLSTGAYAWQFIATDGTIRDEGSASCH